jgi:hypothetical protein
VHGPGGGAAELAPTGLGSGGPNGASAHLNVFSFSGSPTSGAVLTVQNIVGAGAIDIKGYSLQPVLHDSRPAGGHRLTTADDGQTKIPLAGLDPKGSHE